MSLLDADRIREALDALADEWADRPLVELILIGGAAMALHYKAREATRDVDAVVISPVDPAAWRDSIRSVAERLSLPVDWLNDGAKGYLHGISDGEVVFERGGLRVRVAAPEQLLAMKLCAWRDDLDIGDARFLLTRLSGEREALWKQVEPYLVPGRELKARLAYDDLCDEPARP